MRHVRDTMSSLTSIEISPRHKSLHTQSIATVLRHTRNHGGTSHLNLSPRFVLGQNLHRRNGEIGLREDPENLNPAIHVPEEDALGKAWLKLKQNRYV